MHFKHIRPKKILKEILHHSILQTPFFAHMLTGGDLFAKKKGVIGLTFSFNEVSMPPKFPAVFIPISLIDLT